MKILVALLLVLVVSPAFGQLSDKTGLLTRLDVDAGGHTFEVVTVANFEVTGHEFDRGERRLTIFANSGLADNLGEVTLPGNLLAGNLTFQINGAESEQKYRSNDRISFITLVFEGTGDNRIDIIGTEIFGGAAPAKSVPAEDTEPGGGCLIAAAAFGTELAPQVQQLRELRDGRLLQTESGRSFMGMFNSVYYAFSPQVADYQRENPAFRELVRAGMSPMILTLPLMEHAHTESEIVHVGASLIVLNIAMYVGLPAAVIVGIRRSIS